MRVAFRAGASALLALAAACTGGPAPGNPADDAASDVAQPAVRTPNGLEYHADTRILESYPVQLHTTVSITNTTTAPVSITMPDGCTVLLRAYRSATATTPAFDQLKVAICTMALMEATLAPGETSRFEGRTDAGEILGDSLPNGKYWLRAVVRPDGGLVEVGVGEVELGRG